MTQIAMRAPGRNYNSISIGSPNGGDAIKYSVDKEGLALVHSSHEAAVRSLGFTPCADETPDVPAIAALSAEDWAAVQEYKKLQAQAAIAAKATEAAEAVDKAKTEAAQRAAQAAASVKRS